MGKLQSGIKGRGRRKDRRKGKKEREALGFRWKRRREKGELL